MSFTSATVKSTRFVAAPLLPISTILDEEKEEKNFYLTCHQQRAIQLVRQLQRVTLVVLVVVPVYVNVLLLLLLLLMLRI